MLDADLGFRPNHTVTMTVSLQGTKHRTGSAEWKYYTEALERLRSTPGVEAAGAVSHLPLANNIYMAGSFKLDSGQAVGRVITNAATQDYFKTMGTAMLAGRDFAARGASSEHAVIVNEAFARATGLGAAIVGRKVIVSWSNTPYLVTGLVETSRFGGPATPGGAMIYWPVEEEPPPNLTFVARVRDDATTYLAKCRDTLRSVDPEVPVYDVQTLDQRLATALARPRFFVTATAVLAAIAFLLAIAGSFGAAAHAVAQRTQEFGVRMALGASPARLRRVLMGESVIFTLAGAAAGSAVAILEGRYLGNLLADVRDLEPWTCAAAAGVLVLAALTATWLATARLLAIDPANALRAE